MDRETIEILAREAGIEWDGGQLVRVTRHDSGPAPHEGAPGMWGTSTFVNPASPDDLVRFAALIVEECAKLCDAVRGEYWLTEPEVCIGASTCATAIRQKFGVKE